jgi:hypothetical protein
MTWYYYTGLTLWSKRFMFIFDLKSKVLFVTSVSYTDGVTVTALLVVGHPRSDSVGLLVYDNMLQYPKH